MAPNKETFNDLWVAWHKMEREGSMKTLTAEIVDTLDKVYQLDPSQILTSYERSQSYSRIHHTIKVNLYFYLDEALKERDYLTYRVQIEETPEETKVALRGVVKDPSKRAPKATRALFEVIQEQVDNLTRDFPPEIVD